MEPYFWRARFLCLAGALACSWAPFWRSHLHSTTQLLATQSTSHPQQHQAEIEHVHSCRPSWSWEKLTPPPEQLLGLSWDHQWDYLEGPFAAINIEIAVRTGWWGPGKGATRLTRAFAAAEGLVAQASLSRSAFSLATAFLWAGPSSCCRSMA